MLGVIFFMAEIKVANYDFLTFIVPCGIIRLFKSTYTRKLNNMRAERIQRQRLHALKRGVIPGWETVELRYLRQKGWLEGKDRTSSHIDRVGYMQEYIYSHETPVIGEDELIVGRQYDGALSPECQDEYRITNKYVYGAMPKHPGQASHMAIDYEKLLKKGVSGVLDEIAAYKKALDTENPADIEKEEFYKACERSLHGLLKKAENYAAYASELAEKCAAPQRKKELLQIAENLLNVPEKPAKTFWEALQCIHLISETMSGLYQWGRPDRYLIDYYRNDIAEGRLTKEFAQELIDSACVMFNEYIQSGLAVGFMVGGRDTAGNDVTNELTYMFLESIRDVALIYPGIGLCCHGGTPYELKKLACEILAEGYSHPALFNDETITDGLKYYGLSPERACLYIHSTCVEITPCACSAVWVASPYTNMIQLLLDTLGVKEKNSTPVEFKSLEDLKAAYRIRLSERIRTNAYNENKGQLLRSTSGGDPLVSCFVNDCLARGKDIDCGGALYNWIMPSFVGIANLADAFTVIKTLIFEEKALTFSELADALENNFAGSEDLLTRIRKIPKYGNDIDVCDETVSEVNSWILEETAKHRTYRGDRFIPSLFCWIMHDRFGRETMASPDGRCKTFPLGDGSGPAQGREFNGPTASILSSTKWDHHKFIGGIAVNMKFSSSLWNSANIDKLVSLVDVFMERGGFELQINSVNKEKLLAAREHPELYGDLVVRIGGYSDFFVRLSDTMQREVIERTEHEGI